MELGFSIPLFLASGARDPCALRRRAEERGGCGGTVGHHAFAPDTGDLDLLRMGFARDRAWARVRDGTELFDREGMPAFQEQEE